MKWRKRNHLFVVKSFSAHVGVIKLPCQTCVQVVGCLFCECQSCDWLQICVLFLASKCKNGVLEKSVDTLVICYFLFVEGILQRLRFCFEFLNECTRVAILLCNPSSPPTALPPLELELPAPFNWTAWPLPLPFTKRIGLSHLADPNLILVRNPHCASAVPVYRPVPPPVPFPLFHRDTPLFAQQLNAERCVQWVCKLLWNWVSVCT